ncbi:hypothetical protein COW36_10645 [bacterium (Candidatus Blackallbacteria) CG17_big_fil_post_rev_8_21_14_2_50_48_46]|uniref:Uncharacterized protein n=1 Tax=bacterium (Candidatus Blackallbacteria) CG17_big_fil_post_rev_8_21_14_2_50_48_46 TaxID=2014261 RepID=A0A2M7G4R3_9BACT|nr:MAG: hypothetical protein COW64_20675 [bacterium (Candidatus Blackallbacteria) CG18_big_fil_WC_8_21_14_2_50_49_26]PIW16926.1 MAG: hypothetical protein COW36_10645 [bacterium (Candidatus Blackallbacteria) CG17_big_fil_post_rev_8_21_14_2_50_48_46]PIW50204.1 MAG: hypothetical protein COW20_03155 [bacterium (Candidatus Blackallbacteria) CG13_big_fil_rev_8_21_14_2_50_49_14]
MRHYFFTILCLGFLISWPSYAEAPFKVLVKADGLTKLSSVAVSKDYMGTYSQTRNTLGLWNAENQLLTLKYRNFFKEFAEAGILSYTCFHQINAQYLLEKCRDPLELKVYTLPEGKLNFKSDLPLWIENYHSASIHSGQIVSIHPLPVLKISGLKSNSPVHLIHSEDPIRSYQFQGKDLLTGHQSGTLRKWSGPDFQDFQAQKVLNGPVDKIIIQDQKIWAIHSKKNYTYNQVIHCQVRAVNFNLAPLKTGTLPNFEEIEIRMSAKNLFIMAKHNTQYEVWQFQAGKWSQLGIIPPTERNIIAFEPLEKGNFLLADSGEVSLLYLWKPGSPNLKNLSAIDRLNQINRNNHYLTIGGESGFEVFSPQSGKRIAGFHTENREGSAPTALFNQYYVMGIHQNDWPYNRGFRQYQVWDIKRKQPLYLSPLSSKSISSLNINHQSLFIGYEDGSLEERALLTGQLLSSNKRHNQAIQTIAFSQNQVLTSAEDLQIQLKTLSTKKLSHVIIPQEKPQAVFLSSEFLFMGDVSGNLLIKDRLNGKEYQHLNFEEGIKAITFSKPWVYIGLNSGQVKAFSLDLHKIKEFGSFQEIQKIIANRTHLALSNKHKLVLFNLKTQKIEKEWAEHSDFDLGEQKITLITQGHLEIWDLKSLSLLQTLSVPENDAERYVLQAGSVSHLFNPDKVFPSSKRNLMLKTGVFPALENKPPQSFPFITNALLKNHYLASDYFEDWISFIDLNDEKQKYTFRQDTDSFDAYQLKRGILQSPFLYSLQREDLITKRELQSGQIIASTQLNSIYYDSKLIQFGKFILVDHGFDKNLDIIDSTNLKLIKSIPNCLQMVSNQEYLLIENENELLLLNSQFTVLKRIKTNNLKFGERFALVKNKYLLSKHDAEEVSIYDLEQEQQSGTIPLENLVANPFYDRGLIYIPLRGNALEVWEITPLKKLGTLYDFPNSNLFVTRDGFMAGQGHFLKKLSFVENQVAMPFETLSIKYWQPDKVQQIISDAIQE